MLLIPTLCVFFVLADCKFPVPMFALQETDSVVLVAQRIVNTETEAEHLKFSGRM